MGSRAGRNRDNRPKPVRPFDICTNLKVCVISGGSAVDDLWSAIIAEEEDDRYDQAHEPKIAVVYRRKTAPIVTHKSNARTNESSCNNDNRMSLVPANRDFMFAGLSIFGMHLANGYHIYLVTTRGRASIAVAACVDYRPRKIKPKRKKPAIPRGKSERPPNYDMEKAYFQDVDSFELLEESPSPKKSGTWTTGIQYDKIVLSHLSSALEKWLITKKLNFSCGPSGSLSKILETPALREAYRRGYGFGSSSSKTPEIAPLQIHSGLHSVLNRFDSSVVGKDVFARRISSRKSSQEIQDLDEEGCQDIEAGVRNLCLTSQHSSLDGLYLDPLVALLTVCGMSAPSTLLEVFSDYCGPESIVKLGEGTYGEAFKAGKAVCKIVPFDGDLRVNGEVQKRSEELLEEVILSLTLNRLREHGDDVYNACTTFIETIALRVCQGTYDAALIRAWEEWDWKHGSENDHPNQFSDQQCYVVFVQEHGGQDLESFVLRNFDEACSLLVQVTTALAVAEAAYQFEHRDLHWGNILLSRKDSTTLEYILKGEKIYVKTFGLVISIIDFTLSRINTGEDILFLDLSLDPGIFEGPKGDKQSDTYRKMREVTEECWEGSFPKTNVLWLQYLVDILLLKKSFDRTSKDERELRSLKKRLNTYGSAKEASSDPFFKDLFVSHATAVRGKVLN
ncbi:hypothetical protein RJ639_043323 [Escallonia herrerae]|uniref:non-specific serine/threonine protein kinase n=1 Tax=Escallonia herrerae TaxID=1293975 RepID=A0AA88WGC5_9ASTE|nr:hypothetical protein RJ639_043323 [Escallonia herrerae]